ncbi:MAG: Uma2 family endonuclease [Chloroflexia bacterium]
MVRTALPPQQTTLPPEVDRYRFTVDDYDRMAEAGILHEDMRVELIDGEIVQMAAIGLRHMTAVDETTRLIVPQLFPMSDLRVSVQNPIRLGRRDEPQPDLMVYRKRADRVGARLTPADVLLVIEVSDTTRTYDRYTKLPRYAAAGIPEAWLIDLVDDRVERHTEPSAEGYRRVDIVLRGEMLVSAVLPELAIPVEAIIPPC